MKERISIGWSVTAGIARESFSSNPLWASSSFLVDATFQTNRLESFLNWLPPNMVSSADVIVKPGNRPFNKNWLFVFKFYY